MACRGIFVRLGLACVTDALCNNVHVTLCTYVMLRHRWGGEVLVAGRHKKTGFPRMYQEWFGHEAQGGRIGILVTLVLSCLF